METMKLKDFEKIIPGVTEFVNEFKKSPLHKPVDTIKFVHSKFPIEVQVQVEEYSQVGDDLYLNEIEYKLINGNKKLDITDCVHDDLFEILNCENESAIIDVKDQYRDIYDLINDLSEKVEMEIECSYDTENKESEINFYKSGDYDYIYTIRIKGQKITVEDHTEEIHASKEATLLNLRERIAKLENELGYNVDEETWALEDWDEEDGSDDNWDDED